MKSPKSLVITLLTATALAAAPLTPASAHDHGGGLFFGLAAAGAVVAGTVAAVVTAPVRILAGAPPVYVAPQPYYAAPAYAAPVYAASAYAAPAYAYPSGYYTAAPSYGYYAPGYYGYYGRHWR